MYTLGTAIKGQNFSQKNFPVRAKLGQAYKNCCFFMAKLYSAHITAHFYECRLDACFFTGSKLERAKFYNCKLNSADFRKCKLINVKFYGCDLRGVDFRGAKGLLGCEFDEYCQLDGIKGASATFDRGEQMYLVSPYTGGIPEFIERETTQKIIGPAPKPAESKLISDKLVDPRPLPKVSHYRSTPAQIPESEVGDDDDDDDYEAYYYMNMSAYNTGLTDPKYKYGYEENAVLECSNIDEFKANV